MNKTNLIFKKLSLVHCFGQLARQTNGTKLSNANNQPPPSNESRPGLQICKLSKSTQISEFAFADLQNLKQTLHAQGVEVYELQNFW